MRTTLAAGRRWLGPYLPAPVKQLLRRGGRRWRRPQGVVFAFSGRSHYWPGMGRALYAASAPFRAALHECDTLSQALGMPSVLPDFVGKCPPDWADEPRTVLVLSLLQIALSDALAAAGQRPTAVLGESLGEVAAVYAAGGLSRPDAVRLAATIATISSFETGDWAVLRLAEGLPAAARTAALTEAYAVYAFGDDACLLLCRAAAAAETLAFFRARGQRAERLGSHQTWPYHTARLGQHRAQLLALLERLNPRPLACDAYLAARSCCLPAGTVLGPDYWVNMFVYPVRPVAVGPVLAGARALLHLGPAALSWAGQREQVPPGLTVLETVPQGHEAAAAAAVNGWKARTQTAALAPAPHLGATDAVTDPNAALGYLRRQGPLHWLPAEQSWLVLDTAAINAVLRSPAVFSSLGNAAFDPALVGADPPLHTAHRALLQPFFTPKALAGLAPVAAAAIAELGAGLAGRPEFDAATELALPVVQRVAQHLLGLPAAWQAVLADALLGHPYQVAINPATAPALAQRLAQADPAALPPGLAADLAAAVHRRALTAEAAAYLMQTAWIAGTTTTSMLLTSSLFALLTRPDLRAQLEADPALGDAFLEEVLRLEPPEMLLMRFVAAPTALAGQALPVGSRVLLSLGAANRDPARYPRPDAYDLHRPPARHLAFGGGIHACLGAGLARIEARAVLGWALAQGPALRLAQPQVLPEYYPSSHFRGLAALPLTLQAPATSRSPSLA